MERVHWYFKSGIEGHEMTIDMKICSVSGWERNYKSAEWKQVVAREKTKFEMEIMRERRR